MIELKYERKKAKTRKNGYSHGYLYLQDHLQLQLSTD